MKQTIKKYTNTEVASMSPEERFETHKWIADNTANKSFAHNKDYLDSHLLSRDEVLQFSMIGLWEACQKFDETKTDSPFRNYCIAMSLNKIRDYIRNNSLRMIDKRNRVQESFKSFDAPVSDGEEEISAYDVLPDENPKMPYSSYKGELYLELSEENQGIVDLYILGKDMSTIAREKNMSRQSVYQRLERQRNLVINTLFASVDEDIREIVALKLLKKTDEEISKALNLEERKVKQIIRRHNRDIKKAFLLGGSIEDFNLLDGLTRHLQSK